MQINIETFGADQTIDVVTVKAHGEQDGKALLNKIMAPTPNHEAPSACTLRTAATLFRIMSDKCGLSDQAKQASMVADILERLADGDKKIQTIKAVCKFTGSGLQEAKELTERLGPFQS